MVEDTTVTGLDLTATRENHRTKEPKTTKQVKNQALDTTGPRDQRTEQAERQGIRGFRTQRTKQRVNQRTKENQRARTTRTQGPEDPTTGGPEDHGTKGPGHQRTGEPENRRVGGTRTKGPNTRGPADQRIRGHCSLNLASSSAVSDQCGTTVPSAPPHGTVPARVCHIFCT